jgi:hypothetical protein
MNLFFKFSLIFFVTFLFNACIQSDKEYRFQIRNNTKYQLNAVQIEFGGKPITMKVDSFSWSAPFLIKCEGKQFMKPIRLKFSMNEYTNKSGVSYPNSQIHQVHTDNLDNEKRNAITVREYVSKRPGDAEFDVQFYHN